MSSEPHWIQYLEIQTLRENWCSVVTYWGRPNQNTSSNKANKSIRQRHTKEIPVKILLHAVRLHTTLLRSHEHMKVPLVDLFCTVPWSKGARVCDLRYFGLCTKHQRRLVLVSNATTETPVLLGDPPFNPAPAVTLERAGRHLSESSETPSLCVHVRCWRWKHVACMRIMFMMRWRVSLLTDPLANMEDASRTESRGAFMKNTGYITTQVWGMTTTPTYKGTQRSHFPAIWSSFCGIIFNGHNDCCINKIWPDVRPAASGRAF